MNKLNKVFESNQVLTALEMNQITNKIDELVDGINTYKDNIPDTSEFATKVELEEKVDNFEIADMLTKTEASDIYQIKGNYLTEVPSEYITDSELSTKGYITNTQLDTKLDIETYNIDKSEFALKSEIPSTNDFATKEELEGKVDIGDLSSKQDTLISGTNIKTINGNSLLGEGNIEISGTGSGIADAPSDDKTYGRKNGAWEEVSSGGAVNITDILMRLTEIEDGNKCTQEDYNTLKGYADSGVITYVNMQGVSLKIEIVFMQNTMQLSYSYNMIPQVYGYSAFNIYMSVIADDLTVYNSLFTCPSIDYISQGALPNYQKQSAYSAITSSDTILSAIGKLEAGLDELRASIQTN